jgi:hypothetical protein
LRKKESKQARAPTRRFKRILSGLPSHLTSLSIPFFLSDGKSGQLADPEDNERSILLKALKRPSDFLPSLRVLGLSDLRDDDAYYFDGAGRGDIAKGRREEKRQLGSKRETVRKACEKRGVELRKVPQWDTAEDEEGKVPRARY